MADGRGKRPVHAELTTRVHSIVRVSRRTRLIRLDVGRHPFPFVAGQAVMLGLATQGIRKPYSVASSPRHVRERGLIEVLVGLDDDGRLGPHLAPLGTGSVVGVRGPSGRFRLPPRLSGRSLLFVAGGTGIAPLRSMLWSALERVLPPAIDVVYSARTPSELAFDDELRRVHGEELIRYWPTVTRGARTSWPGRRGRIDRGLLQSALRPSPVCLVCGPASFVEEMPAMLRSLGVRRASIRTEEY